MKSKSKALKIALAGGVALSLMANVAYADNKGKGHSAACRGLPNHAQLRSALQAAQAQGNGGFGLHMWGTIVNRDGVVCAVAFTSPNPKDRGGQWPGSRVISAQKANTANAFSLPGFALSTANLFSAVQPGGSLYGLQHSNPVDTGAAYKGPAQHFGQPQDPMVGNRVGGVNVFGGGLGLYKNYNGTKVLVGGLGVSGDSSCADHNIAWRTRNLLELDYVPAGVNSPAPFTGLDPSRPDNIIYDITEAAGLQIGESASGWGHPACNADVAGIAAGLPIVRTVP